MGLVLGVMLCLAFPTAALQDNGIVTSRARIQELFLQMRRQLVVEIDEPLVVPDDDFEIIEPLVALDNDFTIFGV